MIVALVIYFLATGSTWELRFKEVRFTYSDFATCERAATVINQDNTISDVAVCLTNNNAQRK